MAQAYELLNRAYNVAFTMFCPRLRISLMAGGEGGVWTEAHELPGPLPHVRQPLAVVPRAAAAVSFQRAEVVAAGDVSVSASCCRDDC